jgi:hypothetical protein
MWRKATDAALATLASLGCPEPGVRLLVSDPAVRLHSAVRSAGCCRLDDRLLWPLAPGASGSYGTDESTESTHLGALDLRGGEVPPRHPGELRILAAGDSFTYGHGMSDVDAYPAILEQRLRARGPTPSC